MHKGTIALKVKSALILSIVSSPMALIFEGVTDWLHLNIAFMSFVFGAVLIDHVVGSYVHAYIKKDFEMKKNVQGFFMKTTLIVFVFFLGRGIVHILGDESPIAFYFRMVMRLMVFIYPAGSALVNISIITNGKFPPLGFMNKITKFNNNLDIKEFVDKDKEKE
jgi:hypothetical protein